MLNPDTLERAYRLNTRNWIAKTLFAAGSSMDMQTFQEHHFSKGDLEDAVHVELVTVGPAGITLTPQGERLGAAQLAAEARLEAIGNAVGRLVGQVVRHGFSARRARKPDAIDRNTLR
jgi:hypothetical protein